MKDNRNTSEAADVRRKSEFIRTVEDFATYMQKEYVEPCDGLSLTIGAADGNVDGGSRVGSVAIMLGDRALTTATLASMMRREEFREAFRKARALIAEDDDDMDAEIRRRRRRLRTDCGIAAAVALWAVLLVALKAFGLTDWFSTVTNLLLTAWTAVLVGRDLLPLRRQIGRMEACRREDRRERLTLRLAEAVGEMLHRAQRDEEEDD